MSKYTGVGVRWAGYIGVAVVGGLLLAGPTFAEQKAGAQADPSLLAGPKADKAERKAKQGGEMKMGERQGKDFSGKQAGKGRAQVHLKEALLKDIELTAAQQDQLRQLQAENQAAHKQWREQHGEELRSLREQAKAAHESGDKAKAASIREQVKDLHGKMPSRDSMERIREILTPEQVTQLEANIAALKAEAQARRAQMKAQGGGDQAKQKQKGERPAKMNADGEKQKPQRDGEGRKTRGEKKLDI